MKKGLRIFLFSIILLIILVECNHRNSADFYQLAKEKYAPFDAIVVPGVPFEDSTWSKTMQLRVYWAKILWDKGMTKNIIFSGGAVYTKYSECKIMKLYALKLGIPEEHIFLDSLAEHSTENVFYSYHLAKHFSFKKIAIASDPFQIKMLRSFIKNINQRLNTDIQILPAILDEVIAIDKPHINIDYKQAEAIGDNFINITETQSFKHRIRGTRGLNIDWENPPKYE